ncbi:MAG: ArsR family transcriptional regulator [Bacteroidales bacterium]|nr:ArsR family transcriptional regulator [Bacteroidales bacterium]
MLEALITSKTRIKLMLKFFLNINSTGYLRGLEPEFNESTNAIRQELNRFESAGLLQTVSEGNKKIYRANTGHPLFGDINSLIRKYVGLDDIIEQVVSHLGEPREVYLVGDLAAGIDSKDISILVVGEAIDHDYLGLLCEKAQRFISRTIRYAVFTVEEFNQQRPVLNKAKLLLVWKNED